MSKRPLSRTQNRGRKSAEKLQPGCQAQEAAQHAGSSAARVSIGMQTCLLAMNN